MSMEERRQLADPALGWGPLASELEVRYVPGYHETLALPPHVAEFAEALRRALGESEGRAEAPGELLGVAVSPFSEPARSAVSASLGSRG
jgi:hypothetical protein